MTNWPYLAQFASDLFGSKNKKFLKSKVGEKKVLSVFSFNALEPRYSHFVTQNVDFVIFFYQGAYLRII